MCEGKKKTIQPPRLSCEIAMTLILLAGFYEEECVHTYAKR